MSTWRALSFRVVELAALLAGFLMISACSPSQTTDRPSLLYFRTANCPYRKQMTPVVEEIEQEYGNRIKVVCAGVDQQEGKDLANHHGIIGYPAVLLLDSAGEQLGLLRGIVPRRSAEDLVEELLLAERQPGSHSVAPTGRRRGKTD